MTTTSATSGTTSLVTALGGGSGIDMTALANNLAVAQFDARTTRIDDLSATLDKQISAASSLKSSLQTLASSLGDRVRTGDLAPLPTIANAAVAKVTKGTASVTTSYLLEVSKLAASQTLTSPVVASSTAPVGAGTLTLRFGTIAAGSFTEDASHTAATITIPSGATLTDIAGAINASKSGVTAYVAQTATGAQLVFKGKEGAASGFVIDAAEDPAEPGLAALAWSPATAPAQLITAASDAAFTLDGVAMTSKSNTITDAAPGLSLELTGTNIGAPTKIGFSDPTSAITSAMTDLTSALNTIATELAADVNPVAGDLAKDSGTRALRRALSQLAGSIVMPGAADGSPRTLADLGLSTQRDGTFALDTKRLAATLKADPAGTAAMFTTGLYGVYATFDSLARTATSGTNPGSLGGSLVRFAAQKAKLATQRSDLTAQQERLRTNLVSRVAAADTRIGASRSTLSFIQNQISAWNAKSN